MEIHLDIKKFIESELVHDQQYQNLADSDELLSTGIIDSLGLVKLLSFINEKYSITLDDQDIVPENFETIKTVSDLIRQKI